MFKFVLPLNNYCSDFLFFLYLIRKSAIVCNINEFNNRKLSKGKCFDEKKY